MLGGRYHERGQVYHQVEHKQVEDQVLGGRDHEKGQVHHQVEHKWVESTGEQSRGNNNKNKQHNNQSSINNNGDLEKESKESEDTLKKRS